ncbi:MAG: TIM-barrel domain-containing protein [Myxococcota bacterium]
MTSFLRDFALAVPALVFLAVGCDSDSDGPSTEEFALPGGPVVRVSGTRIDLVEGDRTLWSTGGGAFEGRTFDNLLGEAPAGIWEFQRSNEVVTSFDTLESAELVGDAVELRYRGGDGTATVRLVGGMERTRITVAVSGAFTSLDLPMACDEEGSFHGFGEQYNATDQTGEQFSVFVSEQGIGRTGGAARVFAGDAHTTYFPMPYVLDARGHGLLLHTDFRVEVDICATDPELARFEVVSGDMLDFTVFHGPTPSDVIRQLSDEVGRPARPPAWAFAAPWISIQGGSDIVLAEADALDAASIDVAALWSQDWTGVRMNIGGGFGVQYRWASDPSLYPDIPALTSTLQGRGIRFLAYANPFIDTNLTDHFPDMDQMGLLVRDETGASDVFAAPNGTSSHPDFTRPETDAYVRGFLEAMVADGIDGWMADFGEWTPLDVTLADGSDPRAYHNRFPVEWHRVNREAMDAARPDGDWVLFARSGWTGVQRYSMLHWVGDQEATFSPTDGLPTAVPAMINLGLAGVPYVTLDIGGFAGGPSTKEVYLRWVELGAFSPVMRTHEGDEREENWNWDGDAETIAHFARFSAIHAALAPELEALADQAQTDSRPMVRHLLLEFPEDRQTWQISDQFLLGDSLLVAPVLEEGAVTRSVYLPSGAAWFHVFTGERFEGGQTIDVNAPIGMPAVFSRDADRTDLRAL